MDQQFLRQQLIKIIVSLPQDMLLELVSFVNYLRYKSSTRSGVGNAQAIFLQTQALGPVGMESEIPMYERLSSPRAVASLSGLGG
ncbi:MAG: hypothetical protein HC857_10245 [Synechococcales cyanobacterium RU_4_20]|nr:hypothetical protein [Synechococcales cyanobacterium RU_4_20]